MIHPRREFLSAFFRILDQENVPYCILRNYQNVYEDTSSDIDLAVEPEHVAQLKDCLARAAAASNHHFVLRTRYINYSYVYWHPDGGFLRIDMETEVRWRFFPVLTAKSVVGLRRREGAFYIPHPRHESVILFIAAIWRGYLSDRYRSQLGRLYQQLASQEELRRTFRVAFGEAGDKLAEYQADILESLPERRVWKAVRRAIMRNAWRDRSTRREFVRYLSSDVARLWERLRNPSGISLLYASSAQPGRDMDDFFERIKFLYPTEKSTTHLFHFSPNQKVSARLGLALRLRRVYGLFKGGIFVRFYDLPDEGAIPQVIRTHARYVYPSRTFFCAENSSRQVCLGHVETGFMAEFRPDGGLPVSNDQVIQFVSGVLEWYRLQVEKPSSRRGAFVVLVGLDGSGKTTVARNVCCQGAEQARFSKMRYFHWQPALLKGAIFPLPESQNLPRKRQLRWHPLRWAMSALRLFKNLLLANLAHWLRVRPLLRSNALVLVDRYYYNYFLDPVSVKYYGPKWLLRRVRRCYPRPDLVVVLKASPEVLLSRKQELSREEILRQSAVLEQLEFNAHQTLVVDASRPASDIARTILQKTTEIAA